MPLADGTLVATPGAARRRSGARPAGRLRRARHRLVRGRSRPKSSPGETVAVVGDGAVGLLGVLSAKQMGAERIIAMSRHDARQTLAREFGATDIVDRARRRRRRADQGADEGRRRATR